MSSSKTTRPDDGTIGDSSQAATSIGSNETSAASRMRSQISNESGSGSCRPTPRQRLLELIHYLIFVLLLSIVVYARNFDYVKHEWIRVLSRRFTSDYDWIDGDGRRVPAFASVTSVGDLWRFLEEFAGEGLRPDPVTGFDGTYLLGAVLVQQKRVRPGPCPPSLVQIAPTAPSTCPTPGALDRDPFGPDQRFVWSDQAQAGINAWLPTALSAYGRGGYTGALLGPDLDANRDAVRRLKADAWIDRYTVAVMIDFAAYNRNGNRICAVRLVAQLPIYGGVRTGTSFIVIEAFPYDRIAHQAVAGIEVIFIAYFIDMVRRRIADGRRQGRAFVRSLWNLIDIVNFALILTVIIARIVHDMIAYHLADAVRAGTDPYVDWQDLGAFERDLRRLLADVLILSWLRITKYLLSMSNGLRMIKRVFVAIGLNLMVFVAFLGIVLMGFIHAFFLAFYIDIAQFRSMTQSFLTAYGSIFGPGKFSFEDVQHSNFLLGPILAFAFFLSVELLLGHMFLAIVHGSYYDHRAAEKDVNFAKMVMAEIRTLTQPIATPPKKTFAHFAKLVLALTTTTTTKRSPKTAAARMRQLFTTTKVAPEDPS